MHLFYLFLGIHANIFEKSYIVVIDFISELYHEQWPIPKWSDPAFVAVADTVSGTDN